MHVLEDLWHNCFAPDVKRAVKGSEYDFLSQGLVERREQLRKELSKEGRNSLEVFERTRSTLAEISEEDTFIEGFRMGAKLMLDVLGEYRGQFD